MKKILIVFVAIMAGLFGGITPVKGQTVTITQQPTNQVVANGGTATFSVSVSGTGPFTYQWQFNAANLANNIITTVAGNGNDGYSGDGGAATSADLDIPKDVIFDAFGNLYIADALNNRIRTVATNGIITTVAGGGTDGLGDGGAATNAELGNPTGIAVDTSGNLFIADSDNERIREVRTNGIITTVAGNGSYDYSGDGGLATNAELMYPTGVAVDSLGNLFIADYGSNRIREVGTNGIITTVAGGGTDGVGDGDGGTATNAELNDPTGVAVDTSGNLFIADSGNQCIREVRTNGIITTVAGNGSYDYSGDGGLATNASLYNPSGLAFDALDNLYFADTGNYRIRMVSLYARYPTFTLNKIGVANAGNYTVVITGSYGSVTSAVVTLTVPVPPVIISQPVSQIVAAGSNSSIQVAVIGSGPFNYEWYFDSTNLVQNSTNSTLSLPNASTNNTGNYTVVITNSFGSVTSRVATLTVAMPPAIITQPLSQTNLTGSSVSFSIAVAGIGPFTYQWQFNGTNLANNKITTVAGNGNAGYSGNGGAAINANLDLPSGVAFDALGNLYVVDRDNNRIRMVNTNGIITTIAGKGVPSYSGDGGAATNADLNNPYGVVIDAAGNLFIADRNNNRIRKVSTNGIISTVTTGSLFDPEGVAFDALGNLYIADMARGLILEVGTNGIITTVAGGNGLDYGGDGGAATNAILNNPNRVAFDAFGNLFISDYNNNRIRRVDTNGIITTVAGNGNAGYSGDGGAATNANLNLPSDLTFDASGNLYIADQNNERIREVSFAENPTFTLTQVMSTNAGNYTVLVSSPYGSVTSSIVTLGILPFITAQPQSTSAVLTSNATFSVSASGPGPLAYQWLFDNTNEVDSTTNLLAIDDVQPTNAGVYFVIITNIYGSVTSSPASLTVTLPPIVPAFTQTNGSPAFDFTWSAIPTATYQVQYTTNLITGIWTDLGPPITTTNSAASVLDSNETDPERFYRVLLLQ
ncbi:MAG TPA: immunoglobulin domain-containing protein [Verrucomicrobiae bacterium]|jgi:hypothetical protein